MVYKYLLSVDSQHNNYTRIAYTISAEHTQIVTLLNKYNTSLLEKCNHYNKCAIISVNDLVDNWIKIKVKGTPFHNAFENIFVVFKI